ncbi:MAG: hypothetical protein VYB44_07295 [Bacteroidota bacterium]|nr:hypothetical protein [Bacteroidota bacterium]
MKNVKRFGERKTSQDGYLAFVEYSDGTREDCDETTIERLHWSWISSEHAIREDKDGFTIFGYREDQDIEKVLSEGDSRLQKLL